MNKLGIRNYTLISQAVKSVGTFNPDEILFIFEEELYADEAIEIEAFLKWCHAIDKMFGSGNYEKCFYEFQTAKKLLL